jgi:rSAM/selenodomain-associated transferase 1
MRPLLIIFYSNPALGKVKHRLAATLGEDRALAVYLRLVSNTREISEDVMFDKVVFYSDYIDTEDQWDNVLYKKQRQTGHDIGKKLQNAFSWGFRSGYTSICIIHADCYGLSSDIINEAIEYLDEADAIIGPAKDGGYYMLGLKKVYGTLFKDKNWGTHTVLSDTIENFEELDLEYGMLPVLNDVEEEIDLPRELRKSIVTVS